MNNNYSNIKFDAFNVQPDNTFNDKEEKKYIDTFYESAGLTKDRIKQKEFSAKRFSRRFVVIAATMMLVLSFGMAAYASGFFNFGVVDDYYGNVETASLENSNQFKAIKEYQDYRNTLSVVEEKKLYDEEYNSSSVFYPGTDVVNELCAKYDLRLETEILVASSIEEMFEKSGMQNFLGDFQVDSKGKGQYVYSDQGAVSIIANIDKYCDIECIPNDVFRNITLWYFTDENNKTLMKWEYESNDGYIVKCATFEEAVDNSTELVFCFAIPVGDYVVTFTMSDDDPNGMVNYSKVDFEKIIEKFNFNKLS